MYSVSVSLYMFIQGVFLKTRRIQGGDSAIDSESKSIKKMGIFFFYFFVKFANP